MQLLSATPAPRRGFGPPKLALAADIASTAAPFSDRRIAMGLAILVLGLVLFLGAHSTVTLRSPRAALMNRLGNGPYMLLFSFVSVVGVLLIGWGFSLYRQAGYIEVWSPPAFMRHVTILLMWPAVILVLAAYLPGYIKQKAKHPMLAGVKLWALSHLLSNGDLGSIILFGSFLGWAVYDRIAVKRREQAGEVNNIRFADGGWTNDAIAVGVGTFVYFALAYTFHPAIIGVPVFGTSG
jgi:uncharacterized membrane protein